MNSVEVGVRSSIFCTSELLIRVDIESRDFHVQKSQRDCEANDLLSENHLEMEACVTA